ncbi:hypothetical protein Nmel_018713, partial [Mimus melanotis]
SEVLEPAAAAAQAGRPRAGGGAGRCAGAAPCSGSVAVTAAVSGPGAAPASAPPRPGDTAEGSELPPARRSTEVPARCQRGGGAPGGDQSGRAERWQSSRVEPGVPAAPPFSSKGGSEPGLPGLREPRPRRAPAVPGAPPLTPRDPSGAGAGTPRCPPRWPRPASPGLTERHFQDVARCFRRGGPAHSGDGTSGSGAVPPPSWAGSGAAAAAAAERVPPWEDAAGGAGGGGEGAGGGGGTRAERGRGGGSPRRAAPEAGAAAARVHLSPRSRAVPHRQRLPGRDQLRVRPGGRGPRRRLRLPGAAAGTRPYSLQHHGEAQGVRRAQALRGHRKAAPGPYGPSFARTGLPPLGFTVSWAWAPTSLAAATGRRAGCPRPLLPWGLRERRTSHPELLGAVARAEKKRGNARQHSRQASVRELAIPCAVLEPPVLSSCSSPVMESLRPPCV